MTLAHAGGDVTLQGGKYGHICRKSSCKVGPSAFKLVYVCVCMYEREREREKKILILCIEEVGLRFTVLIVRGNLQLISL